MQIIPVILSGGSGTRLWPMSRNQYPKQYLSLASKNTMLQETILRLKGLGNLADPIIICNTEHRFLVAEQCQQINVNNPTILLEPIGRDTAPAIAVAALHSLNEASESVLLVLSADHVINDHKAFHQAIKIAKFHAQEGKLVTFGIMPTDPETAYGYIKSSDESINGAFKVEEFVEKPNLDTAKAFLENGNYFWNSGMFMFQAGQLIDELKMFSENIVESAKNAINKSKKDLNFIRLNKNAFELSESISIDYALMEKSNNTMVVALDAGWNDVGSWSKLYDISSHDSFGNVLKGDIVIKDTTNSQIYASNHLIATIGVDNLVIIDMPDATLIATRENSHEVKSLVKSLQKKGREEAYVNRKVYRPWGWYDTIEVGKHFQVKKLHINPGAKLSLQMHHKRAEHWVVVSGTVSAVVGKDVLRLSEGDSTYIPIGIKHGLENKSNEKVEIIEVQSGAYLGEDDIVRFEDIYGRVKYS